MVMLNCENVHSEDDLGGNARPAPGRYHMAVMAAEETASKKKATPGLAIEFAVICDGIGPDGKTATSGQTGRTIPLFLSYIGGDDSKTQTCLNRVARLAICCGVLKPGEAKEPDWSDAIGRELVVEVEAQKYEDQGGQEKVGSQVSFSGFWSMGNKAVVNVPKDPTTPGMAGLASTVKTPKPLGSGTATTAKATTTATQAATATKPRASLADQ